MAMLIFKSRCGEYVGDSGYTTLGVKKKGDSMVCEKNGSIVYMIQG
jgi:hypothetical protein